MQHDDLKNQLQIFLRQFIRLIRLKEAVYDPELLKKIAQNIVHLKETASKVQKSQGMTEELKTNAKIIENMMDQELEAEGVEASYYQAARHLIDSNNPLEMRSLLKELIAFSSSEERNSLIDHFAHIAENPESALE
ncbi:MAG: hypothetical protein FJZ61_02655 [Chlamydiae bacterium]|nr:hypothetical protein [Chlamydiota bacterium]